MASPVSAYSRPDPVRFVMPDRMSPCASPPAPVPPARLTVTAKADVEYDAVSRPPPPIRVSALPPPVSVSLPALPFSRLELTSPDSWSAWIEPSRFWMLVNVSPVASPPAAWPVPRSAVTAASDDPKSRVLTPVPPSRRSAPAPPDRRSLPAPPTSESAPAPPISVSSPEAPRRRLLLPSPVSLSSWIEPVTLRIATSSSSSASPPSPVPTARLTVTASRDARYSAVSAPPPPCRVSAPAPPISVSSPAAPLRMFVPLSPTSWSARAEPPRLLIPMSESPSASPFDPVPVARFTVTPDCEVA